jgi:hypothetical protein
MIFLGGIFALFLNVKCKSMEHSLERELEEVFFFAIANFDCVHLSIANEGTGRASKIVMLYVFLDVCVNHSVER